MSAPGADGGVALWHVWAIGFLCCDPGLIMKMVFSKVRPCCEPTRGVAVSMPKTRQNLTRNVLIGGRRRVVKR